MGGRHKRRVYTGTCLCHQEYYTFYHQSSSLERFCRLMKASITTIAISESIVKMPNMSNFLLGGEEQACNPR